MRLPANLGEPKPLGTVVDHLEELPSSGWLYIKKGTKEITLELDCYPAEIDSHEVSEEEITAFEAVVAAAGFKSFLCSDQLQDVIANLELQRPAFTHVELQRAIDFYWRRDAFILLEVDGKRSKKE